MVSLFAGAAGASGVVAGGVVFSEELSLQPAIAKNDRAATDAVKIFFIEGSPSIKSTYACQQREPHLAHYSAPFRKQSLFSLLTSLTKRRLHGKVRSISLTQRNNLQFSANKPLALWVEVISITS